MGINIYPVLILDKLRLGQLTFLHKYDNKRTHFYVFMVQNPQWKHRHKHKHTLKHTLRYDDIQP